MSGSSNTDVMLAGAVAAFTVDMLIYPLDTLKTRQQSQDFVKTFADPTAKTRLPSRQLFKGLYQGIGIVVIATLPAAGTFFTIYEASKSFLSHRASRLGLPQPFVHSGASAMAECAACVVLTPAEVIKQNAQMLRDGRGSNGGSGSSASGNSSTSMRALRHLVRGPDAGRRLLSGYTALVARNLPFTAIQFPIYEYVRTQLGRHPDGSSAAARRGGPSLLETGFVTGASAGLAGSFAALVTTPMDVVKTRIMLAAGSGGGGEQNAAHHDQSGKKGDNEKEVGSRRRDGYRGRSGLSVARDVIAERGVAGLFRGAALRSAWTAVGSGLYLGMYEVSKVWLTQGKGSDDE